MTGVRRSERSIGAITAAFLGAGLLMGGAVLVASPAVADEAAEDTAATDTATSDDAKSGDKGKSDKPAGDQPGNNGTVKIDDMPFDDHPDNEPHVGCGFQVDFYNYGAGDFNATVEFALQNPTRKGRTLTVESGELTLFNGQDEPGGGTDLDASETYELAFTGDPHPQQGYHVKLTIHAPHSQGADVKHKVFWVENCATPPTDEPTDEPSDEPSDSEDVPADVPSEAPESSAPEGAEVPTVIPAGIGVAPDPTNLGWAIVALGGLLTCGGTALAIRRRGKG
ncbi:MAG: hypothetical protein ACRDO1_17430 [Nocardioidaceae bacterium]